MPNLPPVAVVTDTAAGIPPALLEEYNISVVPYWVHMDSDAYVSGVDLTPAEFFERLRDKPDTVIKTGVPSVAKFAEIYEELAQHAQAIVSIHVAGKQSGTCNTAEMAGRECSIPVVVVDTATTVLAEGFVVMEAAKAALAGASLDKVFEKANSMLPNIGVVAILESVRYALQGGRLSAAAAKVGSMLKIHPLIRVKDNHVGLAGQSRSRKKGLRIIADKVVDEVRDDPSYIAVHYAEDEDEGRSMLENLMTRVNCVETFLTRIPIELGVHAGPGSLGVAYYVDRKPLGITDRLERLGGKARDAIRSKLP